MSQKSALHPFKFGVQGEKKVFDQCMEEGGACIMITELFG